MIATFGLEETYCCLLSYRWIPLYTRMNGRGERAKIRAFVHCATHHFCTPWRTLYARMYQHHARPSHFLKPTHRSSPCPGGTSYLSDSDKITFVTHDSFLSA